LKMVVISLKQPDGDGFMFETTTDTKIDDLIVSLVNIHNSRLQSTVIVDGVRGLASYGPMKESHAVGLDEIKEIYTDEVVEKGPNYTADPTGIRAGNPPDSKLADTLRRVAKDLEEYVDKAQVQNRIALTGSQIQDRIANVRGAIIMAYPMGLPKWETVKSVLDSHDGLQGTHVANQILDVESTTLWAVGKEFQRGKLVSDILGKNEKTRVIAKLQKKGNGPPGREPVVSEEERRAMMAHYFKKQEEAKKLSEAEDDDYLNSEWADNRQMKKGLQGLNTIKAPGLRF